MCPSVYLPWPPCLVTCHFCLTPSNPPTRIEKANPFRHTAALLMPTSNCSTFGRKMLMCLIGLKEHHTIYTYPGSGKFRFFQSNSDFFSRYSYNSDFPIIPLIPIITIFLIIGKIGEIREIGKQDKSESESEKSELSDIPRFWTMLIQ